MGWISSVTGLCVVGNGCAAVLVACAAAGCATATVMPDAVQPPGAAVGEPPRTVAVGEIEAGPDRWKRLARFFRNGLVRELVESEAFDAVLDPAPKDPVPGSIVVTGRITDVDDGSEPARFFVGFGVGRAEVAGRFEIAAAGAERLAVFDQRQVSSGGTGQGAHWNPLYLEELMVELGEETARTVVRWRDGEDLEPPLWQGLW